MLSSTNATLQQAQQWQARGEWLAAASAYAQLAVAYPRDHRVLANQGNALWLADLPAAASQAYARALALQPDCPISRRGQASCLRDLNAFEAALALHQQLDQVLDPRSPEGLANLWAHSQVLIGLQHYGEAFQRMACRKAWASGHAQPQWDLLEPQLTVVSEQGYGDTLQFVRFVEPLITRRQSRGMGGGVTLLVEPPLVQLLREGLAWLGDGPAVEPKPNDVIHTVPSLLDLPGVLGVQRLPIGGDAPYLHSPHWPHPARPIPSHPHVGLVSMAGSPGDDPFCIREFHKRSLPPQIIWRLATELGQNGVQLHDLQFGPEGERHRALGLPLAQPSHGLHGFAATARSVAQLDLVISVDTAMAHLAGAMGRPCWVLLPWSADPRWLRRRSSTPWYPHTRLFRQPRPGDWHGAVDALLEFFSSDRVNQGPHP